MRKLAKKEVKELWENVLKVLEKNNVKCDKPLKNLTNEIMDEFIK
jgi:chaperonin cofactor prefoldin